MSEGGGEDPSIVEWTHKPWPYRAGAIHRPAPAGTPLLRTQIDLTTYRRPSRRSWLAPHDLLGADGRPDDLGNIAKPNCVQCGALQLMRLWAGDGRKPTEAQADQLFQAWSGTQVGTFTDIAFSRWCRAGFWWSDQRLIAPRWTVLEEDGVAPNIGHMMDAIDALGGVLTTLRMPRSAMTVSERWVRPRRGSKDAEDAGSHLVLCSGFNEAAGLIEGVSWGHVVQIDTDFVEERTQQASAFASDAWARPVGDGTSRSPSGLTAEQVRAIGARFAGA